MARIREAVVVGILPVVGRMYILAVVADIDFVAYRGPVVRTDFVAYKALPLVVAAANKGPGS